MGAIELVVALAGLGVGWWVVSHLMADRVEPSDGGEGEPGPEREARPTSPGRTAGE